MLVHPGFDIGRDDGMFDAFDRRQELRIDLVEPAAKTRQGSNVGVDSRPAQILEQVIVDMDSVQTGVTRQRLVEIGEVIVDEVRKRLRWVHSIMVGALCRNLGALILPMVQ